MLRDSLVLALDPVTFAESLGFKPDAWQSNCLRWDGQHGRPQALWNCARQSGKSTIAALKAVHRAVFHPRSLILLVSPSLRQSSELFRKVGEWFERMDDKPELPEDNRLSCVLVNGSRIVSLPSSEATIRGFSAVDLVIFDEAARVDDDLYRSVRPMLAVSRGKLIAMSTPFGKRGWWFEAWQNGGETWQRVSVPATDNPRITREFLDSEQAAIGEWWFRQEYLCEFSDAIDNVFRDADVQAAIGTFRGVIDF
jgi:hypothetical protein